MNRKLLISTSILLLSISFTFFLSNQYLLHSILLIFLAYIKHKIYPIKKELLWFIMICVGGAIVEILLVNISHAWNYSNPQFFGIPIWIPIFWGVVGTTMIVVYDGLTNK